MSRPAPGGDDRRLPGGEDRPLPGGGDLPPPAPPAGNRRVLGPLVGPGLRILFVGINPSLRSAEVGHHFARPGNRFWPTLHAAGFTPRRLRPEEDDELPAHGIGVTNIASRPTREAAELAREELLEGAVALEATVREHRPRLVAVVGLTAYRTAFRRPRAQMGLQPETIGKRPTWVLPNPSGLNAHYKPADFARLYAEARAYADSLPDPGLDARRGLPVRRREQVRRRRTSVRPDPGGPPMPRITVGSENGADIELYYEDHGSGRPVVLIHGWPLSGRSWEQQVPALIEAGHRVVTYDRRGFGWSSQPWSGYDYDTFAADLHALMEHLDLRDATLVGFSMGGGEVVRYLAQQGSGRVAKAVLAAAVPPYLYKSADNPDGGLDDATIAQFQDGIRSDRLAFLDGFLQNFFAAGDRTDLVSEPLRQYLRNIAGYASPKGTIDCVTAFGRTDFRGDIGKVDVPTLVIHGDADGIVPFEVSGKRAHEAIGGSHLVLVEGGPHGLNVTHDEQFNRALIEFLAS